VEAGTVPVRAVFFDVGEVLIDESTEYGAWADWLGVPRHTFSAVLGAVIARGEDYRRVFPHFRPRRTARRASPSFAGSASVKPRSPRPAPDTPAF
jgi:hypothetical protein